MPPAWNNWECLPVACLIMYCWLDMGPRPQLPAVWSLSLVLAVRETGNAWVEELPGIRKAHLGIMVPFPGKACLVPRCEALIAVTVPTAVLWLFSLICCSPSQQRGTTEAARESQWSSKVNGTELVRGEAILVQCWPPILQSRTLQQGKQGSLHLLQARNLHQLLWLQVSPSVDTKAWVVLQLLDSFTYVSPGFLQHSH